VQTTQTGGEPTGRHDLDKGQPQTGDGAEAEGFEGVRRQSIRGTKNNGGDDRHGEHGAGRQGTGPDCEWEPTAAR
jgi:hypothetical protein